MINIIIGFLIGFILTFLYFNRRNSKLQERILDKDAIISAFKTHADKNTNKKRYRKGK